MNLLFWPCLQPFIRLFFGVILLACIDGLFFWSLCLYLYVGSNVCVVPPACIYVYIINDSVLFILCTYNIKSCFIILICFVLFFECTHIHMFLCIITKLKCTCCWAWPLCASISCAIACRSRIQEITFQSCKNLPPTVSEAFYFLI